MGSGTAAPGALDRSGVARPRPLTPAQIAWIAAVPCAVAIVLAILWVGPLIGRAFLAPGHVEIYPGFPIRPEPVEHGRYVVALAGPLLLSAAIVGAARRPAVVGAPLRRALVAAGQAALVGFVLYCLLAQNDVVPGATVEPWVPPGYPFFNHATLLTAAAATVLALAVLRVRPLVARLAGWARDTTARRVVYGAVAVLYTALWLVRSINTDATIGLGPVLNLMPWEMDDAFAVLDGRTPLVDFHPVYSHLWPYVPAAVMAVLGATVAVWTTTMATLSGLAVLSIYGVLRRASRSALMALLLYLPFLAISFWVVGSPSEGTSVANVFSIWPMRYGAPYMLAWLTVRHVEGAAPRRPLLLLSVAGLVLINNLEFGLGALAGTTVALALEPTRRSLRALATLALQVAAGLAAAAALVAAFSVVRSGALPDFGIVLEFPRLFGVDGWTSSPMPVVGIHMAMYTTFAAAIALAVVRALESAPNRGLTAMLGWSGAFGLLAATYYLGRSDAGNLLPLFSSWSLALALLVVAIVPELARSRRWPTAPEVAAIFGFALALGSLPNLPKPWQQVTRLQTDAPSQILQQPEMHQFIAAQTHRGQRVGIFAPLGHRIAYELGLDNVAPYFNVDGVRTPAQARTAIDAMTRNRVRRVFIKEVGVGDESGNVPAVDAAFEAAGFAVAQSEGGVTMLVRRGG